MGIQNFRRIYQFKRESQLFTDTARRSYKLGKSNKSITFTHYNTLIYRNIIDRR